VLRRAACYSFPARLLHHTLVYQRPRALLSAICFHLTLTRRLLMTVYRREALELVLLSFLRWHVTFHGLLLPLLHLCGRCGSLRSVKLMLLGRGSLYVACFGIVLIVGSVRSSRPLFLVWMIAAAILCAANPSGFSIVLGVFTSMSLNPRRWRVCSYDVLGCTQSAHATDSHRQSRC